MGLWLWLPLDRNGPTGRVKYSIQGQPCNRFAPGDIEEFYSVFGVFNGLTLGTYLDGPLWTLDTTTFAPFNAIHYLYPPVPSFLFTTELFIVCGGSTSYVT